MGDESLKQMKCSLLQISASLGVYRSLQDTLCRRYEDEARQSIKDKKNENAADAAEQHVNETVRYELIMSACDNFENHISTDF